MNNMGCFGMLIFYGLCHLWDYVIKVPRVLIQCEIKHLNSKNNNV